MAVGQPVWQKERRVGKRVSWKSKEGMVQDGGRIHRVNADSGSRKTEMELTVGIPKGMPV